MTVEVTLHVFILERIPMWDMPVAKPEFGGLGRMPHQARPSPPSLLTSLRPSPLPCGWMGPKVELENWVVFCHGVGRFAVSDSWQARREDHMVKRWMGGVAKGRSASPAKLVPSPWNVSIWRVKHPFPNPLLAADYLTHYCRANLLHNAAPLD
ncbi:hypothetical protein BDK51DRAFT_27590 [Blyttiomyces helicus]|uniref:Uncharacterized protein n=1 Tax=Blyttiomyces helicus TaxID=388810 RepID=A0A4P9WPJ4_9FUNG|nr:hypothetical protein BDK51DRAFT_27590 [Blyttiomyces helicus]|eukprot:RKO94245.1 hypothetical protein BDK51DRAFT_27590 [Blyttiomyces helicus]